MVVPYLLLMVLLYTRSSVHKKDRANQEFLGEAAFQHIDMSSYLVVAFFVLSGRASIV
jgi:hypothetical protein